MREIVIFSMGSKEYGAEVDSVKAIETCTPLNEVANSSDRVLGIANIRNELVPIINLQKILRIPEVGDISEKNYLVFRTIRGTLACVVDGVSKIVKAEEENVKPFPSIMESETTGYAKYVVADQGNLYLTMDADNLISEADWESIDTMMKNIEE